MKEYLYIIRDCKDAEALASPEELEKHLNKWRLWMDGLIKQGKFISGQSLAEGGKTLIEGGQRVIDRPLAEGKELIGGYILLKAESLEHATELAKGCPGLDYGGTLEVREIRS